MCNLLKYEHFPLFLEAQIELCCYL